MNVPAPRLELSTTESVWPYDEPFVISRGAILQCDALELCIRDRDGHCGRSEVYGVTYNGETPASIRTAIEAVADRILTGVDRETLSNFLPAGGARCAVDVALWDLESRQGMGDPFWRAGVEPAPVTTAYTIGIRSPLQYEMVAARFAACAWLKVKVDGNDALAAVEAVHRGAPAATLIVDPNQAWSTQALCEFAPRLAKLNVKLLEQPTPVGKEEELECYTGPVPLCADESLNDIADLDFISRYFQAINIKLDKVGGLTAALHLAEAAQLRGLKVMVGCMGGTSLAMAPGMVLAQLSTYVDLDGPRLLSADRQPGFTFRNGIVQAPYVPSLWG